MVWSSSLIKSEVQEVERARVTQIGIFVGNLTPIKHNALFTERDMLRDFSHRKKIYYNLL